MIVCLPISDDRYTVEVPANSGAGWVGDVGTGLVPARRSASRFWSRMGGGCRGGACPRPRRDVSAETSLPSSSMDTPGASGSSKTRLSTCTTTCSRSARVALSIPPASALSATRPLGPGCRRGPHHRRASNLVGQQPTGLRNPDRIPAAPRETWDCPDRQRRQRHRRSLAAGGRERAPAGCSRRAASPRQRAPLPERR